jgi:hypothetical protein
VACQRDISGDSLSLVPHFRKTPRRYLVRYIPRVSAKPPSAHPSDRTRFGALEWATILHSLCPGHWVRCLSAIKCSPMTYTLLLLFFWGTGGFESELPAFKVGGYHLSQASSPCHPDLLSYKDEVGGSSSTCIAPLPTDGSPDPRVVL